MAYYGPRSVAAPGVPAPPPGYESSLAAYGPSIGDGGDGGRGGRGGRVGGGGGGGLRGWGGGGGGWGDPSEPSEPVPKYCHLLISVAGSGPSPVVVRLFSDICPRTCRNFASLCSAPGTALRPKNRRPDGPTKSRNPIVTYRGTEFHRVVPGFVVQGGDFDRFDGSGGYSIFGHVYQVYGSTFPDESFEVRHNSEGILSMANRGPNTNGSQFFLTLGRASHLDGRNVAFGRVVHGMDVVRKMGSVECDEGERPTEIITVVDCGTGTGGVEIEDDDAEGYSKSASGDSLSSSSRSGNRLPREEEQRRKSRDKHRKRDKHREKKRDKKKKTKKMKKGERRKRDKHLSDGSFSSYSNYNSSSSSDGRQHKRSAKKGRQHSRHSSKRRRNDDHRNDHQDKAKSLSSRRSGHRSKDDRSRDGRKEEKHRKKSSSHRKRDRSDDEEERSRERKRRSRKKSREG